MQGRDAIQKTGARQVAISPLITQDQITEWENYTVANQGWAQDSFDVIHHHGDRHTAGAAPYNFSPIFRPIPAEEPIVEDYYLPIWQTSPIVDNQTMINFDTFNFSFVPRVCDRMMQSGQAVLSETINAYPNAYGPPESFMAVPIYDTAGEDQQVAAVLIAMLLWEDYFINLVPEGIPPMVIVVRNPCVQEFTYRVNGPTVEFVGLGDMHDPRYEDIEVSVSFDTFVNVEECANSVHVYPTHAFHETYVTNRPAIYTGIATAFFGMAALVFLVYDLAVKRKHKKITTAAKLSHSIVRSLFPEKVRARLMGEYGNVGKAPTEAHKLVEKNDSVMPSSKPIADLFPNATVLFADIAGFTAWSSEREPSQVFTLLETIYDAFDRIAAKSKVFKVETIGDCYVAAAGLPEAREDHAVVMARFARDCLLKMSELVHDLEISLGPDTAELGMRAGLHSGPVTAGVLRGDKSRFQLFGDTVKIAARMESSGQINCIHLSQHSADLILSGCDDLSVRPGEQMIDVKGKGKMQTYWLICESPVGSPSLDVSSSREDKGRRSVATSPKDSVNNFRQIARRGSMAPLPSTGKQERLLDWNVDILQKLLKKIVAMRKDEVTKPIAKIAKMKIKKKGEDQTVIDEVQESIRIPSAKDYERDPSSIELGSVVLAQLRDFVTIIALKYRKNSFHSFEHASHVTQSVIKLLGRIVAPEAIDYDNLCYKKKENAVLHYYTYGITSDPLTQFAVALAALIHDVDHEGVPNAQLVKENTADAKRYMNKSVAEQNSVDMAWDLLMQPDYIDLRACVYNSRRELTRFRQLVVTAVMATDIVDKDLKKLRNDRWATAFDQVGAVDSNANLTLTVEDMNRKATIVIEHLIQASDVSHTMQHWHVYIKWNERFFHECYQAYLDGRAVNDPSDGWFKGELGFFDFYIIPLAKKLKECGVFGVSSDEFLNYAESNRAAWEEMGQELVEKFIATYKEKVFGGFRKRWSSDQLLD
jgi:class 3 adenylate cyclase